MPFSGLGSYSVTAAGAGRVDIAAGLDSSGTLTFTGGSYDIATSFLAGINFTGATPLSGLIRLAGGTDMTFAPGAGLPASVYIGADLSGAASPGELTAYGYLDIFEGSTLEVTYTAPAVPTGDNAYASFIVGGTDGASGQINVDGEGSILRASGDGNRVTLGLNGGQGTLAVTNRGSAEMLSLQAGAAGGLGQVYLSGGSSELIVSSAAGRYIAPGFTGQSGAAVFGTGGGAGFLGITGGARMTIENVDGETDLPAARFGIDNASYGYGIVTGLGSRLTITQHGAAGDDYGAGAVLNVGEGGLGVLLADNDGRIDVSGDTARVNVSAGAYVQGVPSVTEAESLLRLTGGADLTIDSKSYGGSVMIDGALQSDGRGAQLVIAGGQGTHGRVVADGDGTTIRVKSNTAAASDDVTGQIVVGNLGYGALEVRNEATVSARNIELGRSLTSSGGVQAAGNGTLSVTGGGVVTITTNSATAYLGLQIADAAGSIGAATVTGVGSELVSTGGAARIQIGDAGTGTLNIQNGGHVAGLFIEAGGASTGVGTIVVSGDGATLDLSDEEGRFSANAGQAGLLRLGGESGGAGSLRIENGGAVTISNDPTGTADLPSLIVGSQIGSTGYVDVSGAGSVLEITLTGSATDGFAPNTESYFGPRLRLGEKGGAGQVTVRDGGAIILTGENAELRVGEAAAGFTSDLSSFAVLGGGSVLLESTGTESAALVVIGRDDGSRGELNVSGADSSLTVRSDNVDDVLENGGIAFGATITVGQLGDGALRIDDGGQVIIDGTNDAFPGLVVGEGTPAGAIEAVGSVDISGSGSLLEITGTHPGAPSGGSFGEGGLIAVGLHAGSSGDVTVSAGAAVRNSVANSVMLVASTAQSSGTVRVQGDGSLLFAGALLSVAAAVDLTTVTADGLPEIDTAAGGTGLIEIGEGARVEAGLTVIGGSGVLTGDGILASDLDLSGELVIGGIGGTGSFEVTGDAHLSAGAQISLDILAFDPDQADRLIVGGDLIGELTFDDLNIVIDAAALAAPVATLTLIEVDGEIQTTDLEIVTDLNAVLRLRSESGTGLLLDFLGLRVTGTDDADVITGSSIGDTVFGSLGADTIEGLAGDDLVDFSGSPDAVLINLNRGTAAGGLAEGDILISIEEIIGSSASDRITGSDGGNRLTGGDGDDELIGRLGSDTLDGGAGSDVLLGGAGDDSLLGGGGADTLSGGAGNDALNGEAGEDTLFGGAGDDELEGRNATDRLFGGTGDDILDGGKGNDTIEGGPGNDTLVGGADVDSLFGGAGDDVIEGGNGADTLAGSAGRDLFLFGSVEDSPAAAADRIVDFQLGRDRIDLSPIDADPGISGDLPFIFIGQEAFTGAAGELRLHLLPDSDQSRIEADIDANGIGDLVIILDGLIVLDADSFIL